MPKTNSYFIYIIKNVANSQYNIYYVGHGKQQLSLLPQGYLANNFPKFLLYIRSKEDEFDIHVNPNSCTAQLWSKHLWLLVLSLRSIHQWPYGRCEWLIRNLPQKGHNRNVQMQKLECILGLDKSPSCICVLQSCYPHDDLLEQVVSTLLMTTAMWHSHEFLMNHHITLSA